MKKIILNLQLYKILSQFFIISALLFIIFTLYTCTDEPVGPESTINAGLTGTVYDTSGYPLDSVRIYCLYNFGYVTASVKAQSSILRISNSKNFEFNLYQNFPNPVQNSTYLRFSLPAAGLVYISITERASGKKKYSYSKSLPDGLYQMYLNNLVDSLQLTNGPYIYSLKVKSTNGTVYNASKEMFVASDQGSPNYITKTNGKFTFGYGNAFVGDSVAIYSSDLYPAYNESLGRNITLLFERRGYYSFYDNIFLNPKILIHSDIIMTRSNQ